MKYQFNTLRSYADKCRISLDKHYENVAKVHFTFSYGNRKIGKTLNINTLAVATCGAMCTKCGCVYYCYAIKDAMRFRDVLDMRARNTALLRKDRERYFAEIAEGIARHKSYEFIRWHVSGEIADVDYFAHMVDIARRFPSRRFWTYTKQYAFVNLYVAEHGGSIAAAIPSNLVVMFSNWDGFPMDNPYGFPVFYTVLKGHKAPAGFYRCGGNCDFCKEHNCGCVAGMSSCVDEH